MDAVVTSPIVTSIRNTFIELKMQQPDASRARANSAPASYRAFSLVASKGDANVTCGESISSKCSEAPSTYACTEMSDNEGVSSFSLQSLHRLSAASKTASSGGASTTTDDDTPTFGVAHSPLEACAPAVVHRPAMQPPPPPTPRSALRTSLRSCLRSGVKEWVPMSATLPVVETPKPVLLSAERELQDSVSTLVTEVIGMFGHLCVGTQVRWHGGGGWPLSCTLRVIADSNEEQLLAVAKKAFLKRSWASSSSVWLLGSKKVPFTPLPQGFICILTGKPNVDKTQLCKTVYHGGFCQFGERCLMHHPASTLPVRFEFVDACFAAAGVRVGGRSLL